MAEVFLAVGGRRSLALWVCGITICLLGCWSFGDETPHNLGDFQSHGDVGLVAVPGSAEFQPERAQYRIAGSGANVWGKEDAFQFLWKKTSGDLAFSMDVEWIGKGKVPHRKACAMVRQDLEADSPYVDVAIHGDGLIALQYRTEKGALTMDVQTPVRAPATVKLERDGDVFTVSVAKNGGPFQPVGALSLALSDPVYAGLAVCSHSADVSETAVFSHVAMNSRIAKPGKKRVRETSLETLSIETGERKLVFRERNSFEAPNWSRDGKRFYINRQGAMFTIPVEGGEPAPWTPAGSKIAITTMGLQRLVSASLAGRQVACVHVVRQERPRAPAQQKCGAAADAACGRQAEGDRRIVRRAGHDQRAVLVTRQQARCAGELSFRLAVKSQEIIRRRCHDSVAGVKASCSRGAIRSVAGPATGRRRRSPREALLGCSI